MIKVSQLVEEIIFRDKILVQYLQDGLINSSALARAIKPQVEKVRKEKVSMNSVLLAINRLVASLPEQTGQKVKLDSFALATGVCITALKKDSDVEEWAQGLRSKEGIKSLTIGEKEISIISDSLFKIPSKFSDRYMYRYVDVGCVTVFFSADYVKTPGLLYHLMSKIYGEDINIIEIVSTASEVTLVVEKNMISKLSNLLQEIVLGEPDLG